MRKIPFLVLFIFACMMMVPMGAIAQKVVPFPTNAGAPTLKPIFPAGAKRGSSITLNLTGTNLAGPVKFLSSFPCKATFPTENNNGKDAAKLAVKIDIDPAAPIGFHAIRIGTAKGISNTRILCIDDLPEVLKVDSNKNKMTPQVVTLPCVVSGKIDAESNDYYKINVKAGQEVSFEVLGRRLGGTIDPQINLIDSKTMRELPKSHSNDSPGAQTDPRLRYVFQKEGDYLVEVRDVSYRGGEDYHYRLRMGDFPLATSPIPMAMKRGTKGSVNFAGPAVETALPQEVIAPVDPLLDSIWIAPKGKSGLTGWPVCVLLSDLTETMELEPNNEPAKANKIAIPSAITARLLEKGDLDHFSFSAKKDQRLIIEATSQDLYSPTEVYMALKDAKGAKLAETNPTGASRFDFKAPADGDYTIAVEHLHLWGGPAEIYRLSINNYEPGFDLSIGGDHFDGPAGAPFSVPVNVTRRDYADTIEVSVEGPKGITGKLSIPKGQPAQAGQPAGNLNFEIDESVAVGPQLIRIVGTATINGKPYKSYASVRGAMSTSLAGLPIPPRTYWNEIALGVLQRPAFMLSLKIDPATIAPGKNASATVTANRAKDFTSEIVITVGGLPANVTAKAGPIPANMNEVKFEITSTDKAAPATPSITVTGKAKGKDKEETHTSPGITFTIKK